MGLDSDIDVCEVSFDEFERRKRPRENRYSNEFKSNTLLQNQYHTPKEIRIEYDFGIEVHEILFEQFKHQKTPK